MLPPFRVKNIISPDSTPQSSSSATSSSAPPAARRTSSYTDGVIRMSKEAYDDLLKRLPEAVLSYIDEEDGEVVLVSDSSSRPRQNSWPRDRCEEYPISLRATHPIPFSNMPGSSSIVYLVNMFTRSSLEVYGHSSQRKFCPAPRILTTACLHNTQSSKTANTL